MSYEGNVQLICENGHLTIEDTYHHDMTETNPECSVCKGKILWENQVDETNGEAVGLILMNDMNKYFKIQEEEFFNCPTCKHTHMTQPNLYRIPSKEETANLRTITDYETNKITYLKDIK